MYEPYTRQALPTKRYRELLGTCLCVFNSNYSFIIENYLATPGHPSYTWYALIDLEAGKLKRRIDELSAQPLWSEISSLFSDLVTSRNRIIHSSQITNKENEQVLATKTREKDGNQQFEITEEYMLDFIRRNETLSSKLHQLRGY